MERTVIYNSECPICSREIAAYRRQAEAQGLPLRFCGLSDGGAEAFGLTQDAAARRLHVVHEGRLLAGVPAFVALWEAMPRLRWLARLVSAPVVRPVAEVVYERLLAPALYRLHLRRVARRPGDDRAGRREKA